MTHCGGAQTINDSDLKRRVSDLDVQARAPETEGEVFLLLITEVCPLINIPFPDHGSAAVNIPSFGL